MARGVENKTRLMLAMALEAVIQTVTVPHVLRSAVKMEDTAKRPSKVDSGHVDMEAALGMEDTQSWVTFQMLDVNSTVTVLAERLQISKVNVLTNLITYTDFPG